MEIRDFQRLIDDTYRHHDAARGAPGNFLWFVEEVGELAEALRKPDTPREELEEEFADVVAWLSSIANIKGIDLEAAVVRKYGSGCPRCRTVPCRCGNPTQMEEISRKEKERKETKPEAKEYPLKDKTYAIIGAAMEVHRVMGPGFLEAVYQRCLAIECARRGIPFVEQPRLELAYKDERIDKCCVADFLFYGDVLAEIKAIAKCTKADHAQTLNALKASGKSVALLLNFGEPSLSWKRFAHTRKG